MKQGFFILREGQKRGPYTAEELKLMQIRKMDLIALSENAAWTEAIKVKELQHLFEEEKTETPKPTSPSSSTAMSVKVDQYDNSPFGFGSGKITFLENNTLKIEYPSETIYYRYASFGERLGARLLDVLIIVIPSLIPFVGFFLNWLYFSLQHAGDSQQTIGQKALNIKLVSANGRKIEFGQATGRFFGNLLNCLTLGVGFLMFFFSRRNQCLHDSVSNTLVVSELKREKH